MDGAKLAGLGEVPPIGCFITFKGMIGKSNE